MTKSKFLERYREELRLAYPWAQDEVKLDKFMKSVEITIRTTATTANLTDSPDVKAVWKAIGCKGKPTYKALRALEE